MSFKNISSSLLLYQDYGITISYVSNITPITSSIATPKLKIKIFFLAEVYMLTQEKFNQLTTEEVRFNYSYLLHHIINSFPRI